MPADSVTAGPVGRIARQLHDGYEVHRAALRYGFDVTLYPRQVLVATRADEPGELSFVHGVPQQSTLSAVTYAQDKRMRRELLARAGLPVPPGATFAIGRELAVAKTFAEQIGYPVAVKPAVGENLAEVTAGIRNVAELESAIDYLRTPELDRPTFSRTAYALTLLLEPDEEDGRSIAPAGYQFLVERHVEGDYLHLVTVAGQVRAAVHRIGDSAAPTSVRDVTDELHPSLAELALQAATTIPGLATTTIGMVVADHHRPVAEQEAWIVDFSERPYLAVLALASAELGHRLGEELLSLQRAAAETEQPPRDEVSVTAHIEGCTDPDGVAAALTAAIAEHGLAGQVAVADRIEGTAEGTLQGSPNALAMLFELLVDGQLDGQRARLVEVRHS
ncbi:hypothetical protein JQS43_02475 [Natronosporangium hydrolyticum]|uniref:ATP-grasp domain-containing protein n=1 Tax=Natronosporangium hydrolyticum TaxID=2811111 RepID=A0A895YMC3_9ACTN|nr:hypothetical protein [Natronosporangium hydrolyticum]QSB15250.1 hypothetical protein JQS43_02475 [Natronosporangium hydrolyticum]